MSYRSRLVVLVDFVAALMLAATATAAHQAAPAGPPTSIVATVSGSATFNLFDSSSCVNVYLSDGATGNPVEASSVSVIVEMPEPLQTVTESVPAGTTDSTGNGTFCANTNGPAALEWSVTAVDVGSQPHGVGATGNAPQTFWPLTTNTFTQQPVVPCPPQCNGTSPPSSATPTTPASTTTTPDGASTTPASTSATPAGTTTPTTQIVSPATSPAPAASTGAGAAQQSSSMNPTVVVTRLPTVVLSRPSLALTARASTATVVSLILMNARGSIVARWTRRAKAGVNKLSLPLPSEARHPGRDNLRIDSAGGKAKVFVVKVIV